MLTDPAYPEKVRGKVREAQHGVALSLSKQAQIRWLGTRLKLSLDSNRCRCQIVEAVMVTASLYKVKAGNS